MFLIKKNYDLYSVFLITLCRYFLRLLTFRDFMVNIYLQKTILQFYATQISVFRLKKSSTENPHVEYHDISGFLFHLKILLGVYLKHSDFYPQFQRQVHFPSSRKRLS